jgi:hypothetical protein
MAEMAAGQPAAILLSRSGHSDEAKVNTVADSYALGA